MKKSRILLAIAGICTLTACGGGGGDDGAVAAPAASTAPAPAAPSSPAPAGTAPVANAGAVQNLLAGTTVTLDGSASSATNGAPLTYSWVLTGKPAGSQAVLLSATSPKPSFVADVAGAYTATLVVNDGKLASQPATTSVNVAIGNAAPTADAGPVQNVVTRTTVTLDGSLSADANGDPLTYNWTFTSKPAGSTSAINTPSSPKPTFVADVAGSYVVSLVVDDGKVNSQPATMTVTATAANAIPVAHAGVDLDVIAGKTVTLDGSASSDANADPLTYSWSLTSKPATSSAAIGNPAAQKPTFTADVPGVYVASLTVNDGKASSQATTVTVTAAVANTLPVANAGPALSAYLGDLVRLDGSASRDADGDPLTYSWTVKSYPGIFAPTMSGETSAKPSFSARDKGIYVFSLVVNDGRGASAPSTVTVNVADGVAPTPAGTGLVVQKVSNIWTINEATMSKQVDFNCGYNFQSIDRRPDGVIVAVTTSQFLEVNPAGACSVRGSTPEWITSVAVSPQGQAFGMSLSQYSPSGTRSHRLYKLSSSGAAQSFVQISGATNYVQGMDFGPDGYLYGMGITGSTWSVVRIDPETGINTVVFVLPVAPTLGDIDIDASGVLRTVIDGVLYKFNVTSGALLSTTTVPDFSSGNAFAPIVYIP